MTELDIKTARGRALMNALAALEWVADPNDDVPADRVLRAFRSNCTRAGISPEEACKAVLAVLANAQSVLLARMEAGNTPAR